MNKIAHHITVCAYLLVLLCVSCKQTKQDNHIVIDSNTRIVSLSGTTTEVLCALGLQDKIVGVDVTSTYPDAVKQLPKVGHNRNMSAEAIIALKPTIVIGIQENIKPQLAEQIQSAHVTLLSFPLQYSVAGAKELIAHLADTLGYADKGVVLTKEIDSDENAKIAQEKQPNVLFIYARGAGTLMAAGNNTSASSMIDLAGGKNAANGFDDFKPITAESLVAANPDVILMFDSGLQSLGGVDGLLQIPGVAQTNAGKNKRVIEMDGQFLTGFGPRTGKAIAALSKMLHEISVH
ncbi:heme/hemin ABC transporter substrate-binding protein [Taibaiella soli]|uniref:Hemin ABC transporter substrate-binding protein n=1 Tax=Taibaiella soli TaxID=1649169 RepID=A0A2W2AEP1_9BACT|nr:hemin ABC transporter substrate-binding protein [Taibaiella soli]PZF73945.1 hemin ABC transporter substrate-binding protein [Taibaiella soli]